MPFAAGMFCTTTVGLAGRYLPTKRAIVRAPRSVTPPGTEPTIIRTVLPRKATSPCANARDGRTQTRAVAMAAVAIGHQHRRKLGLLPPPFTGEGWGGGSVA